MKHDNNISDAFTLEDIRKIRNSYAERYTDHEGNIDWDGMNAEIEKGAARIRADILRLRAERPNSALAQ